MTVLTLAGRFWRKEQRGLAPASAPHKPVREKPPRHVQRRGESMGSRRRSAESTPKVAIGRRQWALLALKLLALGLLLGLLAAAAVWLVRQPMFQIRRAVVTGELQQVDRELVAKRARTVHGNFFTLDLNAATAELRTIPWVRSVTLRRLWPNGLEVQVQEQHVAARWGENTLLNTEGEVFTADYSGDLPHLEGPPDAGVEMLQALRRFDQALVPLKRHVALLTLSERRAWGLQLDNGLGLELGRDNVEERLQRFVRVYPAMFGTAAALAGTSVDLRYPNGFALRSETPGGGS